MGEKKKKKSKGSKDLLTIEAKNLTKRHITKEVCRKAGYGIASYGGRNAQVANFYDRDGLLCGQKVRLPDKQFRAIGDVTDKLFGTRTWRGRKRLVITEGEIDALSYLEVFPDWSVASIPLGVTSAKSTFEANIDLIEAFDEVIIAFDNDKPGKEAARECAAVLTPGIAKLAILDDEYKDFNEALKAGNTKAITRAVWDAETYRPDGVIGGTDIWDKLRLTQIYDAAEYPWPDLNIKTRGLRKGELVTITAGSGTGKSAICREIAYSLIKQERTIGLMFLEENIRRTALGVMGIAANEPLHLKEDLEVSDYEDAYKETIGSGKVYMYDHFGSVDVDNLLSRVRFMVKSYKADFIILDHLSIVMSGLDVQDERKAIDMAMTKLRTLVEETGAGIVLVSHLKRPSGDRGHENGLDPQLSHLRGSHSIGQLSDIVIGASRNQQDETDSDLTKLIVLKNRFSGETGYTGTLSFDHDTGRLNPVDAGYSSSDTEDF